ncbi:MAG: hypothetical protein DHS20C15_17360 [Planctomycetota bacterium]|nr:MAG: hypothetical protein DHS20C15_17360 [Planctomycetota bacterium]
MPEDVYFERIAGVGAAGEANKPLRQPKPELVLSMDDDLSGAAPAEDLPATNPQHVGLDENGFPLNPLKNQDQLWFVQAGELYRPIERVANTARSTGALVLISGLLTVVISGIVALAQGDPTSQLIELVVGAMLITLGAIERSAARDILRAVPRACSRLVWNQMMLFGVVALWCGSQMKNFSDAAAAGSATLISPEAEPLLAEAFPGLSTQLTELQVIFPSLVYGFFGFLVVMSLIFQGTMALYYNGGRRKMKSFREDLPPWVAEIVATILAR